MGLEIDATKAKVVSAQSLTKSLTTFEDFYQAALPEERRELIRLRVNQLIWTPEDIRLALIDHPYQMFDESQHLVARTLDSTNSGVVWDKFHVYQGHRVNTPYIQIGTKRKNPPRLKLEKHPNAIRRALHYKELLDSGAGGLSGRIIAALRHAPHHDFVLPASPRVG